MAFKQTYQLELTIGGKDRSIERTGVSDEDVLTGVRRDYPEATSISIQGIKGRDYFCPPRM